MNYIIWNKDQNKVVYVGKIRQNAHSLSAARKQAEKLRNVLGYFDYVIYAEGHSDYHRFINTIPRWNIRINTHTTVWATNTATGVRTHMGSVQVKYNTSKPNTVYLAEKKSQKFLDDVTKRYRQTYENFTFDYDL